MNTTSLNLPWLALLLLGAGHGINPAMGWLFAVARGLQERREAAVWRTLGPLAAGHALAIAAAVGAAMMIGASLPVQSLRWAVAGTLLGLGVYRLFRHRHPSAGGMRVGMRELTLWSFMMASGHGAGLMVLPFMLRERSTPHEAHDQGQTVSHAMTAEAGAHSGHLELLQQEYVGGPLLGIAATVVHTAAYLFVTGCIAAIVYRKLGLRLLRRFWINMDLIWALILIATAAVALL